MKKIFVVAVVFFALFVVIGNGFSVCADEKSKEEIQEEFNENIDEIIDNLDTDELEKYLESFGVDIFEGTSLKEQVKNLITGDYKLDYSSVASMILSMFLGKAKGFVPVFALILAICVFMGVMNTVKGDFLKESVSDIIHYVCFSSILVLLLTCLIPIVDSCSETVESLRKQMELVFPVILTLMAAGGASVSVSVYQPAVAFLSDGVVVIITDVVFPFAILALALSMVGSISGRISLKGFCGLFKSVNKWIMGASLTLFSVFLTVQGITSATYDGLSLKAAKYAIGNGIPVIGSFLSSGADLVLAGCVLIKNSFGVVSVAILLFTVADSLIMLAAFSLLLKLVSAVCEPIADSRMSAFFAELSAVLGYFTAGVLAVSFSYFMTLLLLICSSGVLF